MTTFTVALGVSGTLNYRPDYKTLGVVTGDFADIRTGAQELAAVAGPAARTTTRNGGSYANWNNPKSIDDFWHTAVNGRGTYFSAERPDLGDRRAGRCVGRASRCAPAPGSGGHGLEPRAGRRRQLRIYTRATRPASGPATCRRTDINLADRRRSSRPRTGRRRPSSTRATGAACDNRNIYLFRAGRDQQPGQLHLEHQLCDGAGNPTGAPDTGLNATEQAHFGTANVSHLSQYPAMTDGTARTVDQRTPAAGANLVNFLRGQRGLEGFVTNDVTKLYRAREHVLGDIVNGQPAYVRAPFASYGDAGLRGVQVGQRGPHADALRAGQRRHAARLLRRHQRHRPAGRQGGLGVHPDARCCRTSTSSPTPTTRTTTSSSSTARRSSATSTTARAPGRRSWWPASTAAARATTPSTSPTRLAPKGAVGVQVAQRHLLRRHARPTAGADCHLGYTYGKPLITKLADGTWVVMVTSGYNNVNAPAAGGRRRGLSLRPRRLHRPDPLQDRDRRRRRGHAERPGADQRLRRLRPRSTT